MNDFIKDSTTGFVAADELALLAEEPSDLAAAGTPATIIPATAITTVIVGASAALQGACPTSGCTVRC